MKNNIMNKFKAAILVIASVGLTETAQANGFQLSEKQVQVNVDVTKSADRIHHIIGESLSLVRVSIPELINVTALDLLSLASYGLSRERLINGNPAIEKVTLTVRLEKRFSVDDIKKVCKVLIYESVNGQIRGFDFSNSDSKLMEKDINDCR